MVLGSVRPAGQLIHLSGAPRRYDSVKSSRYYRQTDKGNLSASDQEEEAPAAVSGKEAAFAAASTGEYRHRPKGVMPPTFSYTGTWSMLHKIQAMVHIYYTSRPCPVSVRRLHLKFPCY